MVRPCKCVCVCVFVCVCVCVCVMADLHALVTALAVGALLFDLRSLHLPAIRTQSVSKRETHVEREANGIYRERERDSTCHRWSSSLPLSS